MEKKNRRGLPCPGRPKKVKGSGLVSGRSGRRRLLPAGFSAARFAPRPPAKACGSVPGSKIFTEIPRRRLPSAAFLAARFAPRPSRTLAASFRGAKSSQKFRAASRGRPALQRRDLLPAPRKALRLRPGEQNLHRDTAPPPASGGLFSGAICSSLPANPCSFVPGSKIFTEIPRRRLPPAAF